jgi:serine/threonine-protein kinase
MPTPLPVKGDDLCPREAPMGENTEPQSETIDASVQEEMRSLCAQFGEECEASARAGTVPRLDAYVARVPESNRSGFRAELERIQERFQHTQFIKSDERPVVATVVCPPDVANAQAIDPGTIEYSLSSPSEQGASIQEQTIAAASTARSAKGGDQPNVPGYEIVGELGRGGMGVVYKARQRGLNRWVALKMVLAGAHAGAAQLARFQTEAEAVARLQHPNIVQIYDVGELDGLPYFSLEYIDGLSLDQKIHRQAQPPQEAAHLVETLARAMHYAHESGIIHRDLKPANVLMTSDGKPKITDFGLAKRLEEDSSQTKSGTLMGTPSYMAPEQARGEIKFVGPLADVYSLGAMLYELLTGRPPFLASTAMDTIMQVTRDEAMAPARIVPDMPPDIETICMKCLQKEPEKRYQSALALAEDLERFQIGEPILARPVGNVERLWRWCKRNPKLAAASAAILLLLLVVSVGSTWAAFTIRAEKELALKNEKIAQEQKVLAEENEQKAKTSEQHAEDQATLALQTLGLLVNKVQSQLGKQPAAQQLKRDLLQTALNGLKRVTGGAAAKTRRYTNDAYHRMGEIARELGNSKDAHEYATQCYEMAQTALKDNPEDEHLKLQVARACRQLADISHETGDLKKALAYCQSALSLRKELAAVPFAERRRRNEKAVEEDRITPWVQKLQVSEEYQRIGVIHYRLGESAQAEEPVLKALALRENLVSEAAGDTAVLFMSANPAAGPTVLVVAASLPGRAELMNNISQDLTRNYHLIGEIYFRLRNLKQSRLYYQKCEDIRERILRDDESEMERLKQLGKSRPPDFRLMSDLAEFHEMYSAMLLSLGAPLQEVLPHVDRALELSRRVLEIDKAVEPRQNLARALYSRGVVAVRANDPSTATKCFSECLEIREELADKDARSYSKKLDLLEVLARAGRHERAAQLAEQLRLGHENDSVFLIRVARCYAQCSLAVPGKPELERQYLEMALAALKTALEHGYKDLITLETHPDLDPLRKNPVFKKLLEKVSKPPSSGVALNANR